MFVSHHYPTRWIAALLSALLLVGIFNFTLPAQAAHIPLEASVVSSTDVTMAPGETKEVLVEFKNVGSEVWHNDGAGYVSLYTYEPKYRGSLFDPGTWLWGDHVKRIRESTVAPGETASLLFELHAPDAEGVYEEVFQLASEDVAWIEGGEVRLSIDVTGVEDAERNNNAEGLGAELTVMSANQVKAEAGKPVLFTAAFTNTGSKTWNSYSLHAPDVAIASNSIDFSHPSWDGSTLVAMSGASVAPGAVGILTFSFNAPQVNGLHTTNFQLTANGADVPGAMVEIPVEVIGGTPAAALGPTEEAPEVSVNYIDEPLIRIGVLIVDEETDNEVVITSLESDFELRDTEGNLLAQLQAGDSVTAYYYAGKYYFERGKGLESSSYGLRFDTLIDDAPLRVVNWDKRLTRGSTYADNEFRNVLELRYNDYKDRAWLINEIGMESYLYGLAETSDADHVEYNKAQVTAARSYAYYHVVTGGKRASEFMDLNSTPSDQYYLGYGREKRAPTITSLVDETSGSIVTYEGAPAITPYYARSNGATKDWSQVWWGDQPHARGVPVPCDVGKTQWGHGVGMPQSGAECMAEDGSTWKEILMYFYTGIEIQKLWE